MRLRALYEDAPTQQAQTAANQVKRAQKDAERQVEKQQRETEKRRDAHDDAIKGAQQSAEERDRRATDATRDQERARRDQEKEAKDQEHDVEAQKGQRIQRRQIREKEKPASHPRPAQAAPGSLSSSRTGGRSSVATTHTSPTPFYIPTSPQRRAPEAPLQGLGALHFMDRAQLLYRHGWET
jgi:hypothetical protein